jgi:hypothetical protein
VQVDQTNLSLSAALRGADRIPRVRRASSAASTREEASNGSPVDASDGLGHFDRRLTPAGPAHRHERLRRLGAREEVPDESGYKCRVFERDGMRSSRDDGEPAARQRFEEGIGVRKRNHFVVAHHDQRRPRNTPRRRRS